MTFIGNVTIGYLEKMCFSNIFYFFERLGIILRVVLNIDICGFNSDERNMFK